MVWGGTTTHNRTPLVIVAGNLTGIRYWDEIVQRYVIPFIQAQHENGHHCCLDEIGIHL
jgi:hypothetical protein